MTGTMTTESRSREPLTPERITTEALSIVDEQGADKLSMRRLGQKLGVDPMAIYYHIPSKTALYDGIVEHLWNGVMLPPVTTGESWQNVLHSVFSTFRRRLLEHPNAVVLVGTRPATTPTMLRLINDTLGRLETAGLPTQDAMPLIDCLSGFTIGKVMAEISEPTEAVKAALSDITLETHPHLIQSMMSGTTFAPDEQFERGLRALIHGWV